MKIAKIVTASLMTLLLTFSLVYCNFFNDKDDEIPNVEDDSSSDVPLGSEVGDKCYAYDLKLVDGNGETVNIKDFVGKTVVVNFWGTWCGPCKAELPHFNELAAEYADEVVFLIIHTSYESSDASTYINTNFPGSKMIFAYDTPLNENMDKYFVLLGGSDYYPRTLVLDKNGIITHTVDGAISYDRLKAEIDNALSK